MLLIFCFVIRPNLVPWLRKLDPQVALIRSIAFSAYFDWVSITIFELPANSACFRFGPNWASDLRKLDP